MDFGVALSGGGAKGVAHLGILKALEENGLKASYYTGTSAGSIVAAAKALGYSNQKTTAIMHQLNSDIVDLNWLGILAALPGKFQSLQSIAKGKKLKSFLREHFDCPISDVKHPLAVFSSNINTGSQVIFSSQDVDLSHYYDDRAEIHINPDISLAEILYASAAIPVVFPPMSYNGAKLVDGSITNNLPASILKLMGAPKVIAVDLSSRHNVCEVRNIFDIVAQSLNTLIDQNEDYSLSQSPTYLYVGPDMREIGLLDFNKTERCFEIGYQYGKNMANAAYEFIYGDE